MSNWVECPQDQLNCQRPRIERLWRQSIHHLNPRFGIGRENNVSKMILDIRVHRFVLAHPSSDLECAALSLEFRIAWSLASAIVAHFTVERGVGADAPVAVVEPDAV